MPSPDWSASEAAARGPKIPFRGRVWRAHWREVDPTDWKLSLGSSGRYHQGRDIFSADQCWAALYTSLTPEVAVWEMVRRSAARNLDYLRNNVLTELDIDVKVVLDATEPASIGPQIADLTGTDPSGCRQLALAAIREGCEGLLVPSAAMQGTNLVLFPNNLPDPLPATVVSTRALQIELTRGTQPLA